MQATYHLQPGELNEQFFAAFQAMFSDKAIHISVETTNDTEDETAYLMRSKANAQELLERIQYVKNGGELIPVNLDDWK